MFVDGEAYFFRVPGGSYTGTVVEVWCQSDHFLKLKDVSWRGEDCDDVYLNVSNIISYRIIRKEEN